MTEGATLNFAAAGQRRIAEASRLMPVTRSAMAAYLPAGSLSGVKIGSALFPDPKSAAFLQLLQGAGADVSTIPADDAADDEVAGALAEAGVSLSSQGAVDILLDEGGAGFAAAGEAEKPWGVVEQLARGRQALTAAIDGKSFDGTAISLDQSELLMLADAQHGRGQSAVMAFVDITNLQLGGRTVLVSGFDAGGEGVAHYARAFGARVTVAESDPLLRLRAVLKGYKIADVDEALAASEIVFLCGGASDALTLTQIAMLGDGSSLCVAGNSSDQLPVQEMDAAWGGQDVRQHVRQYKAPGGAALNVIGNGRPIAKLAGEGSPVEAMDIVFGLYAGAIAELIECNKNGQRGLVTLSAEIEASLIRMKLDGAR